ncbi:chitobiase/beta-hexosaminidase C-terminal domain-containing protein [Myxococcus eversor]|uniref:chitobiase/beta-hexosaminidase C-terminal domain-containing protein n=1 Tax=Myxococcus eversor TaxID=2709661 RepID=UPI0013CF9373|nr:chitobiase/beta-hexosaminidase C-terminal domain-containing protein [Myxococcus eversor]
MSRNPSLSFNVLRGLLILALVSACGGGGSNPDPDPSPDAGQTPDAGPTKDTTAPTTAVSPAGGLFNAPATVTLTCDDGTGSGCEATYYTLDGSAPTTRSILYSAFVMVEASATLRFFSLDRDGNSESAHSAEFVVDEAPPTVSASPGSGPHGVPLVVTLTCDDGTGSGCERIHYTLDGSVPSGTSPRYAAPLTLIAGARLRFIALDRAGNVSPEGTELYSVDTSGPVSVAAPRGGLFAGSTQVSLTCDDAGGTGCARIRYTLDGTTPTVDSPVYGGPLQLTSTTTVSFFSVDAAGNVGALGIETYVIDTVPPTASATPQGGTYTAAQSVSLSCDDTGGAGCSALHYTTDGTAPGTTSPRYTAPLALPATTTLRFLAVDAAGNVGVAVTETYSILLDSTAPTTVAQPEGGVFRTSRTVTLACGDGAGSGCAETWYTLDDSVPTPTTGQRYTGPLTLSATTRLRFVSRDVAGNLEAARLQVYTLDGSAPVTQAAPPGGTFSGPVTVRLTCTDAPAGCGETRYTLDGTPVSSTSPLYTGPLFFTQNTTLNFRSVDTVGNQEQSRRETYVVPDVLTNASAQIAAVRATADGNVPFLPIENAIVTFVKPGVGNFSNDGPGFFLQAKKEGPALFVEVNPSLLTPPPVVGNSVRVLVVGLRTWNGMRRASIDAGTFAVRAQGFPVEMLAQEVSSVDVPMLRDQLDSELISLQGVVNGPFSASGTDHVQAPLVTTGVPANSSSAALFRLRVVTSVNDSLELTQGCEVSLTAPLWLFTMTSTTTQPSIWVPQQLTAQRCPPPKVLEAQARSATELLVRFDRNLAAASLAGSGAQFTINGLTVTGATLQSPREVLVTTTAQTPRGSYVVQVAATLRDLKGDGVQAPNHTAAFRGFAPPARLRITEVAPNMSAGRDLVELLVLQSGPVTGMTLTLDASPTPLATFPDVDVQAGDVIVMHLNPDLALGEAGPRSELTSPTEHPRALYPATHDTAWDFHGGSTFSINTGNRVLRVLNPFGAPQDGLAVTIPGNTFANFLTDLSVLQGQGQWSPATCDRSFCSYTSVPNAWAITVDWSYAFAALGNQYTVGRIVSGDHNDFWDWAVGPGTFGLVNP